jgi:hypothetical protein
LVIHVVSRDHPLWQDAKAGLASTGFKIGASTHHDVVALEETSQMNSESFNEFDIIATRRSKPVINVVKGD